MFSFEPPSLFRNLKSFIIQTLFSRVLLDISLEFNKYLKKKPLMFSFEPPSFFRNLKSFIIQTLLSPHKLKF
jgi:hypothetical protein